MHRGTTGRLTPSITTAPLHDVVEAVVEVVDVFGLAIDGAPEVSGTVSLSAVEDGWIVVTRLTEHVDPPGRFRSGDEIGDLLLGDPCRYRAIYMLARTEGGDGLGAGNQFCVNSATASMEASAQSSSREADVSVIP